ncbi:aminotransferase class IV [Pontibacter sp. JH31]|uniref:branched-chain-amino-acid transaminase n=1 Tax=Pontibacter aquaedesilientis TaxID=2766980 RepID=A0ABR7XDL9_9BACT|nr:aminotransferase class IV [Pontibacter aquaedesilientis]MBD1396393.1 aminotransferase class IV [Pontibacter aquaedesilientis]
MQSNDKLFAYNLGEIVPLDQAFLHISDLSVQRGYGIFDFVKVHGNTLLFLEDYLDRLFESGRLMELEVPLSREELKSIIFKLTEKNALEVSGMKIIMTGGYSEDSFTPAIPNLLITQQALHLPGQQKVEKGIKIITHDYVREFPAAKTINYSMGIRLIGKIKSNGAEEVLYYRNGVVSEFPRCNFFIVRQDNTVVTPAENVLKGITRKNVLELAGRRYNVEQAAITLEDIAQAKEAFLTSTTKRILPIVQVDDQVIGTGKPGEVTLQLLQDLVALEEQYVASQVQ